MAYVLTSISGNLISAASAGYAPTNSADVSAIASAYQVVSSTSTQLYAGTAFLTEVNGAPVSASRAGNAANAGMANSAYYDGAGRLISSLPDSAAVSSIASSYAESAASGKLDSSASSSFYSVDNPSGFITGVDLSDYATTEYVDSAVSGKADSSALSSYALSSDVSGVIDTVSTNSASWGGGATGDYVEKSAMEVAIGSGNYVSSTAFAQGADNLAKNSAVAFGRLNTAGYDSMSVGQSNSASSWSVSLGNGNRSKNTALGQGYANHAESASLAQGEYNYANSYSLAQGRYNSAVSASFAQGKGNSAYFTAAAFGTYNLRGNGHTSAHSAAFVIGDGTASGARHDLMLVTKDGEITMYSSTADTAGTGIMSSIRAISAAATGGGVDSATVSAIASSYVESGVSSKLDTTAFNSGDFYSTSNPSGFITGVDLTNYATTAYVDSSVSGKLDTTAFNSGDFYTTANESGYVGSAYVDSAVSGKADSSALSSYVPYSSLEYNTARAISGINGSALAAGSTYSAGEGIDITDDVISVEAPVDIVAGPGIVIDNPDGNTLRVSTDENYETVLWEQSSYTYGLTSVTLTESYKNFETIKVYTNKGDVVMMRPDNSQLVNTCCLTHFNASNIWSIPWSFTDNTHYEGAAGVMLYNDSGTMKAVTVDSSAPYGRWEQPEKIVGIHRIAGGN